MKIIGTNALIAALFLCSSIAALLIVTKHSSSVAVSSEAVFSYAEPPTYTAVVVQTETKRNVRERKVDIARAIIPEAVAQTVTETAPVTTTQPETLLEQPVEPTAIIPPQFEQPDMPTEEFEEVKKKTPITISVPPVDAFSAEVIAAVHRLTNAERKRKGLPTLTLDTQLTATAMSKADSMAKLDYFAHTDPHGCDFTCLLKDSGYKALAWGENLMQYSSTKRPTAESLAETTVKNWLKSSGHRENILNADYTHEGVAVIKTGNTYYIVSHYTKPK